MLEQVQSFLRHIQDFKPSSLLPHQEEGPSHQEDGGLLARLSHGDVGGVFRQAGSRVRMRVRNRKDAGVSSDLNTADIDVGESPRSPTYRPPHTQELKVKEWTETGQYPVELVRGPKGFGFSLRGDRPIPRGAGTRTQRLWL
ncbi:PREDICTED: PDZ domain-containing protein MAGIX [Gekko japonicus]|uniref:PDZ domain-containing protein MAGIX n=1 Tax=Gekko japonicus TaxID=146911 RepID=A0ABM1L197_GEKJA|nr:PREDICTED: PDZ domain-containing protein MAGIX [Gekko japonicus]